MVTDRSTASLAATPAEPVTARSGDWNEDFAPDCPWQSLAPVRGTALVLSSVSSMRDEWAVDLSQEAATGEWRGARRVLADLGWTEAEALETRMRLKSFEEDWNAPGMEAYDRL